MATHTALVTGGNRGIGLETARLLARRGLRVVLGVREAAAGEAAVQALKDEKLRVGMVALDVADKATVEAAVLQLARRNLRIDVLVNNAGIAGADKPTHELSESEWDRVQAINVKGVFFCTKHAIPAMRRAGGGSIINLSSIYGLVGAADVPPYHASKGAVRLMSKTDALFYAPDRIRVNSIHPGYIRTPMVEGHVLAGGAEDLEAALEKLGQLHPLGRLGDPQDVAWGVVYLASDEAGFVTGSELVIDGGYTAR